jgi:hypothetical protein
MENRKAEKRRKEFLIKYYGYIYFSLIDLLTGLNTCFWSLGLEAMNATTPPPNDAIYAAM